MLDIKKIRANPDNYIIELMRRGHPALAIPTMLEHDAVYRDLETKIQALKAEINSLSGPNAPKKRIADNKFLIEQYKGHAQASVEARDNLMDHLPNIPHDDVPNGTDEKNNVLLREWGSIPTFDFEPKAHYELFNESMDFSTKLSGSRYVILRKQVARLHRALGQFMLDLHVDEGFVECNPPLIVLQDAMYGTGQFPKFQDDAFEVDDYSWLIPTSEVPLVNQFCDTNLKETVRVTALTQCFRQEAGSAGRDTRGLMRQHQFEKVEMVSICPPEDSDTELEYLTGRAEAVLQALNLPYRVMRLCAGDMGFAAAMTNDLEVWIPSQNKYREISSCSNCTDFQARRCSIKINKQLAHTLNGSGLAVGRALIAVLENYQQKDGSIVVPKALVPYMNGIEIIEGEV